MKQFDYYEFTAILVPGAAFLISLGVLFPDVFGERYLQTISVGDFGIFVVAAYVFGHIIQSFGNIYERIVWKFFKGQPTDWILAQNNRLFTAEQTKQLHDKIHKIMNVKLDGQSRIMMPLTRQIYTILKRENKTGRIDIFNANYGLNRALYFAQSTTNHFGGALCFYTFIFVSAAGLLAAYGTSYCCRRVADLQNV